MNLTDDAMQVSLRITAWSGRLHDRETSNHVAVHHEPATNLAETAAFMDGENRILVFSIAGGTDRYYHADLACGNPRRHRGREERAGPEGRHRPVRERHRPTAEKSTTCPKLWIVARARGATVWRRER